MTIKFSRAGNPYDVPKRSPEGGQLISFWANTAQAAALRELAERDGSSIHQAAKRVVAEWTASQEKDR